MGRSGCQLKHIIKRPHPVELSDGTLRDAKVIRLTRDQSYELIGAIEKMVKAFYYRDYKKVLVEHCEVSVLIRDRLHPKMGKP